MTTPEAEMMTLELLRRRTLPLVSALALSLIACGGSPAFDKTLDDMWQWDGGVEASRVLKAIEAAEFVEAVPAAVGVTGRGLVGRTLPDGELWNYEGDVDVLPSLVGDLVIFSGGGLVTALNVSTGKPVYSMKVNDRRLEGAGYDGQNSILLLVDSDDAREDQILVVDASGNELYSASAKARLGTPAAVNGVGLVPYSGQYIGGFDLATGEHLGRLLIRDGLHTAKVTDQGVTLFGAGATRMDGSVTSSPDSRSLKLGEPELPGKPSWPVDGSKPRPARGTPVGLYAYPETNGGKLSFAGGGYAATYFEVVIGLDYGTNNIRWATHFPRAIAGGDAGPEGPTLCLENGAIVRVNMKDGHHIPYGSLETKVKACVVSAAHGKLAKGNRGSVLVQLADTISGTGPDMVAIQKVLLKELDENESADTTKALLAIAQNPLVSADLTKEAARRLKDRKNGGEEMIAALLASAPQPIVAPEPESPKKEDQKDASADEQGPDASGSEAEGDEPWSETPEEAAEKSAGTTEPPLPAIESDAKRRERLRPPPVGPLAKALTNMKTPGAAAALAPYLADPSLGAKDLLAVMKALMFLASGTPEEVEPVRAFVAQYKNTGGEGALIEALSLSAHFLFKYLSDDELDKLDKDLKQSLTHPLLRKKLEANPPQRPKREKKPEDESEDEAASNTDKASNSKK